MKTITKLSVIAIVAVLLSACSEKESNFDGIYTSIPSAGQTDINICEYESGKKGILIKDADALSASFAEMTISIHDGDTIADFRLPNGKQASPEHDALLTRQKISLWGGESPVLYFHYAERAFTQLGKYSDDDEELKAVRAAMKVLLED